MQKKMGFENLTGVDISKDAISTLEKNISNVRGIVSPVNHTPLADNAYDLVVSQFGFEYAGALEDVCASAREMTRLLKTNGQFVALCHIKKGGIYEEVNAHLHAIKQIEDTHFIPAAKFVFQAAFAVEAKGNEENKRAYQRASQELAGPVEALSSWIEKNQLISKEIVGLARHLHNGTIDMFNRRRAFSLEDIIGWLEGMSLEIQAYKGRMNSMLRAALSEDEANKVLDVFKSTGFKVKELDKLFLENDNKPVAWILHANGSQ